MVRGTTEPDESAPGGFFGPEGSSATGQPGFGAPVGTHRDPVSIDRAEGKGYDRCMSEEKPEIPAEEPTEPARETTPPAQENPLTRVQKEAFVAAWEEARKILVAGKIAVFNGWTLLILGGLSALMGLGSLRAMLTGGALLALGWNELRGRTLLQRFDPQGPRILGWNQVALMGVIVLYCAWGIYRALNVPNPQVTQLEELAGMEVGTVGQLTAVVYGGVIALTAIFQGLLSRYYFLREEPVRRYLRETPRWIVELQRVARPS